MLVTKRYITLMEMMVVIFIIGLITSVLAYKYQGSLEKGKVFSTETAIKKIETILSLYNAQNPGNLDEIITHWKDVIKNDPLVNDADRLTKDGWGQDFDVTVEGTEIKVRSQNLERYKGRGS